MTKTARSTAEIRLWARTYRPDLNVGLRGRLKPEVVSAYEAAHPAA